MAKNNKTWREASTGKLHVVKEGVDPQGNTVWSLVGSTGQSKQTVVTTESSAASITKIAKKHAKALERLAKK